jgi:RNA polymerase sigma-70 factor (ECF subfamily)
MTTVIPENVIQHLSQALEACRAQFPAVDLPFADFFGRVKEIVSLPAGGDLSDDRIWELWLADFDKLHHADLFLALACARGDRIAWAHLTDVHLPTIRNVASRACKSLEQGEDLAQEILTSLFGDTVDRSGVRGKLAGYNARGSLAGWLRVVVSNAAVDRVRRRRREVPLDEMTDAYCAAREAATGSMHSHATPEIDAHWGPVLSEVLTDEIRHLPSKDRLLLGLYYLQEVPLKLIGRHFGVHEATASRWLDRLRKDIRKGVERACRKKHGLKARDLEQLYEFIARDGAFSLPALLGMSSRDAKPASNRLQDPPV